MVNITQVKIKEVGNKYSEELAKWATLWVDGAELLYSGVVGEFYCYVALIEGVPVAYQTVNGNGECLAIEVKEDYQGQGLASQLVEYSGCYKPEQNECPEFWSKMEEIYGN